MSRYRAFETQEWCIVECDCPWEKRTLPSSENFKYFTLTKKVMEIRGEIRSLKKYDGKWESENYVLEIAFLPKKKVFFRHSFVKTRNYALVTSSMKRNYMLFPKFNSEELEKNVLKEIELADDFGREREKVRKPRKRKNDKEQLFEFLNSLGYKKYYNVRGHDFMDKYTYVPVKEFIASHYNDEFPKKKRNLVMRTSPMVEYSPFMSPKKRSEYLKHDDYLSDLMIRSSPVLIYSPFMTPRQQMDHLYSIIPMLYRLKKDHQERTKEFDDLIQKIRIMHSNPTPAKNSLDHISKYCKMELQINLSPLIYNYKPVDIKYYSKSGLYLYKKYNMIPIMMYYVEFNRIVNLHKQNQKDFIDVSRWSHLDDKYLIDEKSTYIKIRTRSNFVNLFGDHGENPGQAMRKTEKRTNNYKIYYLIQRQYFKGDCIPVNLPSKIDMTGSMRIKCLCCFKIFSV